MWPVKRQRADAERRERERQEQERQRQEEARRLAEAELRWHQEQAKVERLVRLDVVWRRNQSLRESVAAVASAVGQARADLASFSRLIRKNFNQEKWPVTVVQGPDKGPMYYADPSIAEAWNNASA